jgi:hypothetical protein
MRIAQVAPLAESVPPKLYGGTERVVSWLTEELVQLGHDVTLFASADSHTNGSLVPVCPRALRLSRPPPHRYAPYSVLLSRLMDCVYEPAKRAYPPRQPGSATQERAATPRQPRELPRGHEDIIADIVSRVRLLAPLRRNPDLQENTMR